MKTIFKHIEGDKTIWAIVAILAIFSFMPVYSASTNLVYVVGSGSTFGHLVKHMVLLIMGFAIIYGVHKIPYRYYSGGAVLMLPIVIVLLVFTLAQGTTIGGANASRWIRIPFVGVGFQTSTLAGLVLCSPLGIQSLIGISFNSFLKARMLAQDFCLEVIY